MSDDYNNIPDDWDDEMQFNSEGGYEDMHADYDDGNDSEQQHDDDESGGRGGGLDAGFYRSMARYMSEPEMSTEETKTRYFGAKRREKLGKPKRGEEGRRVVCWYYLNGRCTFNDRCKNKHPRGREGSALIVPPPPINPPTYPPGWHILPRLRSHALIPTASSFTSPCKKEDSAKLPFDILDLVVLEYVATFQDQMVDIAEENAEDKRNWEGIYTDRYEQESDYNDWIDIIPILTTCKRFSSTIIPQLYRHIIFPTRRSYFLFMQQPALASYNHIQSFEYRHLVYRDDPEYGGRPLNDPEHEEEGLQKLRERLRVEDKSEAGEGEAPAKDVTDESLFPKTRFHVTGKGAVVPWGAAVLSPLVTLSDGARLGSISRLGGDAPIIPRLLATSDLDLSTTAWAPSQYQPRFRTMEYTWNGEGWNDPRDLNRGSPLMMEEVARDVEMLVRICVNRDRWGPGDDGDDGDDDSMDDGQDENHNNNQASVNAVLEALNVHPPSTLEKIEVRLKDHPHAFCDLDGLDDIHCKLHFVKPCEGKCKVERGRMVTRLREIIVTQ